MAESSKDRIMAERKLPEISSALTPLQERIFTFLKSNKPSKAATIAKGVGKGTAKEVNPDLYRMKSLQLLNLDEHKLWSINAGFVESINGSLNKSTDSTSDFSYIESDGCGVSDNKDTRRDSGIEVTRPNPDDTREDPNLPGGSPLQCDSGGKGDCRGSLGETEGSVRRTPLSDLQERIFTFLKSNKPSKAATIAKGVGKGTAKEVNPDLYRMKSLQLLNLDEHKLWSINAGFVDSISGSLNKSTDSTSDFTYIESDGCGVSDDRDTRRDSGIEVTRPNPDDTTREDPNLPGGSPLQCEFQVVSPPRHTTTYNINIYGCQNFQVGDKSFSAQEGAEPIREVYGHYGEFSYGAASDPLPNQMPGYPARPPWEASDSGMNHYPGIVSNFQEYRDPGMAAQETEQQQDPAANGGQPVIRELHTEEDGGPLSAPRTSSPVPSAHCEQTLNISGICDELGNVTLGVRDCNGEECAVTPSEEERT